MNECEIHMPNKIYLNGNFHLNEINLVYSLIIQKKIICSVKTMLVHIKSAVQRDEVL